ncbi:MAG: sensor domain-containing diguanylate cyclase [Fimbriimonadaceae bacterium]|nr:sensor domain-containing diguanylate cyclase [Fimbriimonadaceae bacterium]QYK58585.1 MAG: sensor domain-containing diguanylate cyclase [Fimbriimonadaceae bacterium]
MSTPGLPLETLAALATLGFGNPAPDPALTDGFPAPLPGMPGWYLGTESPGPLEVFNPKTLGCALFDETGHALRLWGLAAACPHLADPRKLAECELADFLATPGRKPMTLHLDGFRFFLAPMPTQAGERTVVLVFHAEEEAEALRISALNRRKADTLKRVGKALTMHQTLLPLAVAAVHAISSSVEAAAVLLWATVAEDGPLELVAHVGVSRTGSSAVHTLDLDNPTCAAEQAAARRRPVHLRRINTDPVTAELEGRFCYSPVGGLMAFPLVISGRLLGLLEVIGREEDEEFFECQDLFNTIAEHLALAVNSAVNFEAAERLAAFDPLTGAANLRTLHEFLEGRLNESRRSGEPIGVVMLDVDHFRRFNEEEGHDAGDLVLKLVTDVLKAMIRPFDLAARYGGEEFTLVLPGSTLESTVVVAERIRKQIERLEFVGESGETRSVTASFGCAVYPDSASDSTGLLKAADIALYEAKNSGRNQAVAFEGRYLGDRPTTENLVQRALEKVGPAGFPIVSQVRAVADPLVERFQTKLQLSDSQAAVLLASTVLLPRWIREAESGESSLARELADDAALRKLLPCLQNLDERFDGTGPDLKLGPTIPLLSRCLAVIAAVALRGQKATALDPDQFDPELVAIAQNLGRAA